jgi:CheY-like chemotaxis protein
MSPDCLADLKIVLVEDHDDARRYLELFLSDLGAKVVVARNGHEGLKAVKDSSPDLVLSDIKMPGMDGLELLDEIRAFGIGCRKQCTCHCDERIFLADRWRPHKSSTFSGHACRSHSLQIN